jgi:hypothetical protein
VSGVDLIDLPLIKKSNSVNRLAAHQYSSS